MLFISKKRLVPTNASFAMVFIRKLFESSLQVGLVAFSPVLFMSRRLRYLLCVCKPSWQ